MVGLQAMLCPDAKEPDDLAQNDRPAKKNKTPAPTRQSQPRSEIADCEIVGLFSLRRPGKL
jgi:hypothetical protein